jgi:amidohydrolase
MKQAIVSWVEAHAAELEQTYHELHSLAERSWQEKQTTEFLQRALEAIEVPYQPFENHTGIVAQWQSTQSGPVIVLRADIDALWQNVDGVWKSNHSCGHDAHMTMALSALKCLKEIGFSPNGALRVIFQPAEETGEGAKAIVESGVLDDADYLLGIHVRPAKEMAMGQASSAIYHGSGASLIGKINGRQAHAARPGEGINVIDSLAAIVNAVNAVKVDPTIPASCKVTKINVPNQSRNVIPDTAEFEIDLRAQTNEAMKALVTQVERAVLQAGKANGAEVEVQAGPEMAAATRNEFMESVVGEAIKEVLSPAARVLPPITPGCEDFHFYPLLKPNLQATMIGLGTGLSPGLHHPQMTFDLKALQSGAAILALSAVKLFKSGARNAPVRNAP